MMLVPRRKGNFDLFDEMFNDPFFERNENKIMKTDIKEKGDKYLVEIDLPRYEKEDIKIELDVVYKDENIMIVNKPANIEVTGKNSITEVIAKKYTNCEFKPKPCHRIDRNTTGLTLFAKNEAVLQILLSKFKNKEIEKHYLAKVYGIPTKNTETLYAYLFKDNKKSMVYISDAPKKGYVKIETSYTVLEKNAKENYSLLDIELHTGKTHQIRAHLAHIGYPIIGDGKYGINEINKKFGCKTQQLCSYKLAFRFKTDAGKLNYLSEKEFTLPKT